MTFRLLFVVTVLMSCLDWARAEDGWVDERNFGVIECRSEFSLPADGGIVRELEQLQSDVSETLELTPGEQAIELNLFRNKRSYVRYLSQRCPEGTSRRALYIQGPDMGRVYVYRHFGYETDVRHEMTHAVLHSALPFLPMWLDEGLAEYFEVSAGERAGGHSHLKKLRLLSRFGWKPRLNELERKQELLDMDGKDYRDSWACVHFLLHGPPEARVVLTQYLQQIQGGDPPGLLSDALARQFPDFDRRIVHHFKSWRGR